MNKQKIFITMWFALTLFTWSFRVPGEIKVFTVFNEPACKDWQKNIENEKNVSSKIYDRYGRLIDNAWLLGFVSGYNASHPTDKDLLGAIDSGTVILWMDRFCKNNPGSSLYDGSKKLLEELLKITPSPKKM
jgi:hypothetical protein